MYISCLSLQLVAVLGSWCHGKISSISVYFLQTILWREPDAWQGLLWRGGEKALLSIWAAGIYSSKQLLLIMHSIISHTWSYPWTQKTSFCTCSSIMLFSLHTWGWESRRSGTWCGYPSVWLKTRNPGFTTVWFSYSKLGSKSSTY